MATYIPNATQTTEPVESRTVESAALEFRTLKASINTEVVNRIAGDANLQAQNNAQDVRLTVIENALPFIGEGVVPGTVYVQRFSGTGVQTAFTLDVVPHAGNVVDIYVNGLYQNKDTFTVSGAVITFSEAPPAGTNNIEVQVTVTIALGETDASLVTYGGTTVAAQLDAINGGNQSLSGNGYQKLPGGLIIQWGLYTTAVTTNSAAISYPIAFPNNVLNMVATHESSASDSVYAVATNTQTASSFKLIVSGGSGVAYVRWIALGY